MAGESRVSGARESRVGRVYLEGSERVGRERVGREREWGESR